MDLDILDILDLFTPFYSVRYIPTPGPFLFAASVVYVPGAQATHVHPPGCLNSTVHVPGSFALEIAP